MKLIRKVVEKNFHKNGHVGFEHKCIWCWFFFLVQFYLKQVSSVHCAFCAVYNSVVEMKNMGKPLTQFLTISS